MDAEDPGTGPAVTGRRRRPLGPFTVAPVGFGAMQLTGPGVFGPPADRGAALRLLRDAVDLGVDHIDTSEYYGPTVVNELIRQALAPYPSELVLVSKVGARRDRVGRILRYDRPGELRQGIEDNLSTLGLDQVPVVNLRLVGGDPPDQLFDDQLAAMMAARDQGHIAAIGLSNITPAHLLRALEFTEIACVQNAFHPLNRDARPVLDECTRRGIAFVPFAPLASGSRGAGSVLDGPRISQAAARAGCTPAQLALAWALSVAPNVVLIPGTSSAAHLRENLGAADVELDTETLRLLATA